MRDLRITLRVIMVVVGLFMINKFVVRPYVLERDFPRVADVFVLSLPNMLEAIAGSMLLTNLGLVGRLRGYLNFASEQQVYGCAVLVAAVYVLTQEFRMHNLGGANVYDPFDVLFSVFGLVTAYGLLLTIKPKIR